DYTTVARGAFRDWTFLTTQDETDLFNDGTDAGGFIAPWQAYRQEVIAINAMTGEIRRLAHHRSRSTGWDYANQPRLSASWGGEFVAWSSNFNVEGSFDVFSLGFALTQPTITDVMATDITGSTATILWATDQLATSQVEYGTTTAYGSASTL